MQTNSVPSTSSFNKEQSSIKPIKFLLSHPALNTDFIKPSVSCFSAQNSVVKSKHFSWPVAIQTTLDSSLTLLK